MPYADKNSPRARLAHKLRDGKLRAMRMGCRADLVTIAQAVAAGLLAMDWCHYCKRKLLPGEIYTLEHKQSLKQDGAHSLDNITKACPACNESKHIQDELNYLARLDLAS